MKKYEGVLKRVREIEWKYGISYPRPDEKPYKVVRFFYFIMFLWVTVINVMHILSIVVKSTENLTTMDDFGSGTTVVGICTAAIILAFILKCTKNMYSHLAALVITVGCCIWLFFTYSPWFAELDGLWGYKEEFYLRHVIPLVLLPLLTAILVYIFVNAQIKTNRLYNKVFERLYQEYGVDSDGAAALSDAKWEEFIKNYDPRIEKEQRRNKKAKKEKYDEQF